MCRNAGRYGRLCLPFWLCGRSCHDRQKGRGRNEPAYLLCTSREFQMLAFLPIYYHIVNLYLYIIIYNIIYKIIYKIIYPNKVSRLFQASLGWGKRRMERGWNEPVLCILGLTQL